MVTSELDLFEFEGFEVELSFLNWVFMVELSLVESAVGLMSFVLFLDTLME